LDRSRGGLFGPVLAVVVLAGFLLAVIPHSIHSSFDEAGVVLSSKEVQMIDLPRWLEPHIGDFETPGILLEVQHRSPSETIAVLTNSNPGKNRLVKLDEVVLRHHADWRTHPFVDFGFDEFVMGETVRQKGFFASVEIYLHYGDPGLVARTVSFLSQMAWLVGPILAGLYIPYVIFGQIRLWNFFAVASLYLYSPLLTALIKGEGIAPPFAALVVLGLLSVHIWNYERRAPSWDRFSRANMKRGML